jgi:hypothetical protein
MKHFYSTGAAILHCTAPAVWTVIQRTLISPVSAGGPLLSVTAGTVPLSAVIDPVTTTLNREHIGVLGFGRDFKVEDVLCRITESNRWIMSSDWVVVVTLVKSLRAADHLRSSMRLSVLGHVRACRIEFVPFTDVSGPDARVCDLARESRFVDLIIVMVPIVRTPPPQYPLDLKKWQQKIGSLS